ncbi:MAG TPA: tetratricopeptide repeat protein, partial [Polyangiaceae bacterium]|nr:tetratricopeptide repeat protein [Polyangiaceae bacterium]
PAPSGTPERTRRPAPVVLLLLAVCAVLGLAGCTSEHIDRAFTRNAPAVDKAIEALEKNDAGAAARELTTYLGTGPCHDGSIGATPQLADRPQASFDLGLAQFQIGERYGARFGEDQGKEEDDPQLLAQRSAEVACALSVLEQVVARRNLPVQLRAEAHYLLGNLEFLRHEYRAAVSHYNRALELVPGQEAETASPVGKDAAHNRALALRRAEEDKPKPPEHPDAGPPPEHSDAGPDPDQKDQDQKDQDQKDPDQKDPDQKDPQEKKPDEPQDQPKQDPKDQQEKPQDQQPNQQDPSPKPEQNRETPAPQQAPDGQEEKKDAPPPPPHGQSLSQDDKTLDQLERAPTVQQEAARAQRGRVRRVVEDK